MLDRIEHVKTAIEPLDHPSAVIELATFLGTFAATRSDAERFLSTIKTNADRLSVLVNELLDISRVDRGVVKLNFQPTDVEEVISSGLAHLRGRIEHEKKELHISSEIAAELPLINADFDKLAAEVSAFLAALREAGLSKAPGVAETLDWVQALTSLDENELDVGVVEATLGAVLKSHEDIERVREQGLSERMQQARAAARSR